MKSGYRVVDADRHIMEPADLWDRYLEPEFRGRVRIFGKGQAGRLVDGESVSDVARFTGVEVRETETTWAFTGDAEYREAFADAIASGFDPASNLRAMDAEGVDVAVLFPTIGLYIMWRDSIDPILAAAICRAYNTWLAEYCSHAPERTKGVALIPLQAPELAVAELRRAVSELGLAGIFWRPNPLEGRKLDDQEYYPIYEAAQALGVPICIHEGANTLLPQAGGERLSAFGRHIASHPIEQMLACLTFCGDGLLERFPELRVGFMESGCGWLPFWLERMDEHWEHFSFGRRRATTEPPSTYFKRQCVISCEAGDELADAVVEHVGERALVLATDYPHSDAVGKYPDRSVGEVVTSARLSDEAKRKLLWDNPAWFYGL